jgi:hypothetical protein
VTYYFEVSGPSSQVNVNLQALASYQSQLADAISPSDLGSAAELSLVYNSSGTAVASGLLTAFNSLYQESGIFGSASGSALSKTVNVDTDLLVKTGQVYKIVLLAGDSTYLFDGSGNDPGPYHTDISSYIDPVLTIDSANADQYSLALSPGVVQSPVLGGVPEPSTWAMMLVGFAGLGYAGYRRVRTPQPRTA